MSGVTWSFYYFLKFPLFSLNNFNNLYSIWPKLLKTTFLHYVQLIKAKLLNFFKNPNTLSLSPFLSYNLQAWQSISPFSPSHNLSASPNRSYASFCLTQVYLLVSSLLLFLVDLPRGVCYCGLLATICYVLWFWFYFSYTGAVWF